MMFSTTVRWLTAASLGVLLWSGAGPVRAQAGSAPDEAHCLLRPISAAQRSQQASFVVEGEVLSADGFWDARHQRIFTQHRVRVFSTFKGTPGAELLVLTEGGTVGDDHQTLTNTLHLTIGDQGVFFLTKAPWATPAPGPVWTPYASQQGFIRYDLTTLTAVEPFRAYPAIDQEFYASLSARTGQPRQVVAANLVLTSASQRRTRAAAVARPLAPIITLLSPLTIPAGTGDILTINGTGFGSAQGTGFVEFANADDGGRTFIRPQLTDYVSWSDTQIQVRVPSYGTAGNPAGTGRVRVTSSEVLLATSPVSITIPYAVSNVQDRDTKTIVRPKHANLNGSGGLTFQFEASFAANTSAAQIFRQDLLQTWRCQTGINWTIGANRTSRGAADDGENSVGFDSGNELPTGVLGRTTSYYRGCLGPKGDIVFYVKEIDMQFDDGVNFSFASGTPGTGQFDFESVAVHELGHAQQLSHVILPAAVMHFGVAPQQVKRTLSTNDITGARFVLRTRSFPPAVCGPASMLPAPLTTQAARSFGTNTTDVTWTTRDECFVREFVVERAPDTTAWKAIGTVPAGASTNSYRFTDPQPLPSLSYYRLRVRRPDGSLDTATPIAVTSEQGAVDHLIVFPNPVRSGPLRLQFYSEASGVLSVFLYDAVGRYYGGQAFEMAAGLNISPLNV